MFISIDKETKWGLIIGVPCTYTTEVMWAYYLYDFCPNTIIVFNKIKANATSSFTTSVVAIKFL